VSTESDQTPDPSPNLRISDLDREAALQALGEHMSVGRIDLDEYGDRSARVTAVKTRGELAAIFEDLPQPHPQLGDVRAPVQPAASTAVEPKAKPGEPVSWGDRPLAQRLTAAAVPVAWVIGIALFFATGHLWYWFLLPIVVTAAGRGLWGQEWENDRQRHGRDHGHGRDRGRDRDRGRGRYERD
jgi:hypothetical protein